MKRARSPSGLNGAPPPPPSDRRQPHDTHAPEAKAQRNDQHKHTSPPAVACKGASAVHSSAMPVRHASALQVGAPLGAPLLTHPHALLTRHNITVNWSEPLMQQTGASV